MVKVDYDDLELAFYFVSSNGPSAGNAYISLDIGKIHWVSDLIDAEEEEVPADVETSDRYVSVPHKNELDLGRFLVTRFVRQALPDCEKEVDAIFRRRGAYGRYKEFLDSRGKLEQWYRFEEDARAEALREWCLEKGIEVVKTPRKTNE